VFVFSLSNQCNNSLSKNPKPILKKDTKPKNTEIHLTPQQINIIQQEIKRLAKAHHLKYGDLLTIAVGSFSKSFPPYVEEFFEWVEGLGWTDPVTAKRLKLLLDRSWLLPIIEKMYKVHIQFAGDLSM
jgi:hypothetical protein